MYLMEILRATNDLPVVLEVEDRGEEDDEEGGAEPGPLPLRHHAARRPVRRSGWIPPHPRHILHR